MIGHQTNKPIRVNVGKEFVGIRVLFEDSDATEVFFPLGFHGNENLQESSKLLVDVLTKFHGKTDLSHSVGHKNLHDHSLEDAARFLLEDVSIHGFLHQEEKNIKVGKSGKINWKQTIQKVVPNFSNGTVHFPFYYIDRKVRSSVLLTNIHKNCVALAQKYMGWMVDIHHVKPEEIKLSIPNQCQLLRSELIHTFNDRRRRVIESCLALYNAIGSKNMGPYVYGTNNFEDIWERLIDSVCSNKHEIPDFRSYYPTATWNLIGNGSCQSNFLRPDTLYCKDDKMFVLDAKYYKYGVTNNPNDLPKMESIGKQNLYGQQALTKYPNLYNAFILPINSRSRDSDIVCVLGSVTPSWNKEQKILAIGVDVLSLMQESIFRKHHEIRNKVIRTIEENWG